MPEISPLLDMDNCNAYEPRTALIVFQNRNDKFIELRPIRGDGSMGAAKGVSKQFIQDLLSSFSKEYRSIPHGEIPPNLLYCDTRQGEETYVWYNPPMKRYRFFAEGLNLENGSYHVPGTIYGVKGESLYVYCFAGKKAKTDTPLLGVPYFNVYSNGKVCMGSAKVRIPETPNLSYLNVMNAWEHAFWNSIDVHTNGSPSTKGNLIETIKRFKDTPFDAKQLAPQRSVPTVDQLIRQLRNS